MIPYPNRLSIGRLRRDQCGTDEAGPKAGLVHVVPSDGTASEAFSGNPKSPFVDSCR